MMITDSKTWLIQVDTRERTRWAAERLEDDWPGRAQTVIPHPRSRPASVPASPTSGADQDDTWAEHVYVQTRPRRARYCGKS